MPIMKKTFRFLLAADSPWYSRYWDDIAIPVAIIAAALAIGFSLERLFIRLTSKFFEKKSWSIGRRLVRSFNGVITVWFGLAAFRYVLSDLPLKPSALPLIGHTTTAVLILSIAILFSRITVAFFRTYSTQHEGAVSSITLVENIVRAVVYLFGIFEILHAYNIAVSPLLAALGVGGLAVALALQDTLSNFFAGIYIISSRNLDPGDYVKLDSGQEGNIRDIAWRVTTMQTPMNTLIIVPNSKFSTSIITNFNRPEKSMQLVIEINLDLTANAEAYEKAAIESAKEVRDAMPTATDGEPKVRYTAITPTGLTLQLSIGITDFANQAEIRHEILKRIYGKTHIPTNPSNANAGPVINPTPAKVE
jgi:small-conductance mechanosensitive channel